MGSMEWIAIPLEQPIKDANSSRLTMERPVYQLYRFN